jgi:PAS domain S-box-containing protein
MIAVNNVKEFQFIYVNQYFEEFTGMKSKEIVGKTPYALVPIFISKKYADILLKRYHKCAVLGKDFSYSDHNIINGKEFWCTTRLSPIKDKNGVVYCLIDFSFVTGEQSISDIEKTALKKSIDEAIFGVAISAPNGVNIYLNKSVYQLWGYDFEKDSLEGTPVEMAWKEPEKVALAMEQLQKNDSWFGELVAERKDGSCFDCQVSSTVIKSNDGRPLYLVSNYLDITNQKKIVRELAKANEERDKIAIKERNRLERELHDTVTQNIFTASLLAEALPDIWEKDIEKGKVQLKKIREIIQESIFEVRLILFQLHSARFSEENLVVLLKKLTESLETRTKIPVSLISSKCYMFKPSINKAIYRIAQQSLNNIVKHAEAKNIYITLNCTNEEFTLNIKDDGIGFSMNQVSKQNMGIEIMKERAVSINAVLDIISKRGEGTEVSLTNKNKLKEWLL